MTHYTEEEIRGEIKQRLEKALAEAVDYGSLTKDLNERGITIVLSLFREYREVTKKEFEAKTVEWFKESGGKSDDYIEGARQLLIKVSPLFNLKENEQ